MRIKYRVESLITKYWNQNYPSSPWLVHQVKHALFAECPGANEDWDVYVYDYELRVRGPDFRHHFSLHTTLEIMEKSQQPTHTGK